MENSKICHVTSVHNWNDIRIFKKQCISLARHFENVSLVAPNAPREKVDGVNVFGVDFPEIKNRKKRFFNLRKLIIKKAIEVDADIYQFHDPELLPYVKTLKKLGKKVIYDSHENVPATIETKEWLKFDWVRKFVAYCYNKYEKSVVKKTDGLISVLPNITNNFQNINKVTVYNYPIVKTSDLTVKSYNQNEIFKIVYHGGLTRQRGIKESCQAFDLINDNNIHLHLIGKWESKEFEDECLKEITDKSRFHNYGQLSFEECQEVLKRAHLGLVLLHKTPNYSYSLPIKLYEYVLNGMAVIMSDIPFWMEEFGAIADFENPENISEIANSMRNIKQNFDQFQSKIEKFQNKIVLEQSWNLEEKKIVSFYKKIINNS